MPAAIELTPIEMTSSVMQDLEDRTSRNAG